MSRYGGAPFPSLFQNCILWAPLMHSAGVSGDIDEFPIIPSGVTVTNNGSFAKDNLGNNKSVLNFNGSTNYISLSDNAAWDIYDGNFTVAGWINLASSITSNRTLYNQWVGDNNRALIRYRYDDIPFIQLYIIVDSTINAQFSCPFTPSISNWYYIVVQRSNSSCLMYIDGLDQIVTTDQAFRNTTTLAGSLLIGGNSVSGLMNGMMKDLMIFKGRALTQPEIKLLMNRTHPITGAGLMPAGADYWRLS